MSSTVIFAILFLGAELTAGAEDWTYSGPKGPKNWAKTYPDCGGMRQSPIELKDFVDSNTPGFTWSDDYNNYEVPDTMTMKNTGRTMVLTGEGTSPRITLSNGKIFDLDHVLFHWGPDQRNFGDPLGSEHVIDGKRYALEMQAVFNRVNEDGSLMSPPEYVIHATLFEERTQGGSDATTGLKNLFDDMGDIVDAGEEVEVEPFAWSELILPYSRYYVYEGSLTSPPCTEAVTFFIAPTMSFISYDQMKYFRKLQNEDKQAIFGNYRPLQKLNNRKVFY